MTRSNMLTAFEKDMTSAADNQAAAVLFPIMASSLTDTTFDTSFLSIGGSSILSMGLL